MATVVAAVRDKDRLPPLVRLPPPTKEVQDQFQAAQTYTTKHEKPVPEYVSQGTSVCVFRPAINCDIDPDPRTRKISKIFKNKESMDVEQIYNNIIQRIDPRQHFTLRFFESCTIDINHFQPAIQQCDFIKNAEHEIHQMIFEDGGDDLDVVVTKLPFTKICKELLSVFKGIETIVREKFVHLDIKPSNMVFRAGIKKWPSLTSAYR